uniref:BRCT domain-containing protein n=1 Tax=Capra hircus TaxID=9925 RepID=A0A8C2PFZ3_CAPHI
MSGQVPRVPEEMFKEVKYYAVGDLDPQVIQLLKAGKAKEVSYNALASHIISEDGDNPEVGEAREVFDLPVVKPSWVILSVQCGALLPVNGFSPESCQIFFGITACLSQGVETLELLLESSRALQGEVGKGACAGRSWEAQTSPASSRAGVGAGCGRGCRVLGVA